MRISGGAARGIPLSVPKGDLVRPATDALRQAVFSSLGGRIAGAHFLDLFAGSGAYGLEAYSRGAAGGVFVEQNPRAIACLRRNLAAVCKSLRRPDDELQVLIGDAAKVPVDASAVPDLVFIDPPYEVISALTAPLFARLTAVLAGHPDPVIVFEMPGEIDVQPAGWMTVKRLGKGVRQPSAVFFRKMAPSTSRAGPG